MATDALTVNDFQISTLSIPTIYDFAGGGLLTNDVDLSVFSIEYVPIYMWWPSDIVKPSLVSDVFRNRQIIVNSEAEYRISRPIGTAAKYDFALTWYGLSLVDVAKVKEFLKNNFGKLFYWRHPLSDDIHFVRVLDNSSSLSFDPVTTTGNVYRFLINFGED